MDIFLIIMGLAWIIPGLMAAKRAIAWQEKRVLTAYPHQNTMDGEDWVGAVFIAAGAFIIWPLILVAMIARYPMMLAWRPTRKYLTPPVQKAWEGHVDALNKQQELVMSTVKTYNEVHAWDPKDHVRQQMLDELKGQIEEQMRQLMRMCDSENAHDGDYLQSVKGMMQKELTA